MIKVKRLGKQIHCNIKSLEARKPNGLNRKTQKFFVHCCYRGAAIAVCITYWTEVVLHLLYIIVSGIYKDTWTGMKQ